MVTAFALLLVAAGVLLARLVGPHESAPARARGFAASLVAVAAGSRCCCAGRSSSARSRTSRRSRRPRRAPPRTRRRSASCSRRSRREGRPRPSARRRAAQRSRGASRERGAELADTERRLAQLNARIERSDESLRSSGGRRRGRGAAHARRAARGGARSLRGSGRAARELAARSRCARAHALDAAQRLRGERARGAAQVGDRGGGLDRSRRAADGLGRARVRRAGARAGSAARARHDAARRARSRRPAAARVVAQRVERLEVLVGSNPGARERALAASCRRRGRLRPRSGRRRRARERMRAASKSVGERSRVRRLARAPARRAAALRGQCAARLELRSVATNARRRVSPKRGGRCPHPRCPPASSRSSSATARPARPWRRCCASSPRAPRSPCSRRTTRVSATASPPRDDTRARACPGTTESRRCRRCCASRAASRWTRAVGWHRGEWEALTGVGGPRRRSARVAARLRLAAASIPSRAPSSRVRFGGDSSRARRVELARARGRDRGDASSAAGPTACRSCRRPSARVLAMLDGTTRATRTRSSRSCRPTSSPCTVEKVAINAVLAGCKPEYLPVVLAAVEAACTDEFNAHGLLATTMPVGPVVIVNGPIRRAHRHELGHERLRPGQPRQLDDRPRAAARHPQRRRRPARRGRPRHATATPARSPSASPRTRRARPGRRSRADFGAAAGADTVTLVPGRGPALHRRSALARSRVARAHASP